MDPRLKQILQADLNYVNSEIKKIEGGKAKNWCVWKPSFIDPTLKVQNPLPAFLGGGPNPLPLTDERGYYLYLRSLRTVLEYALAGKRIPRKLLNRINAPDYLIENFSQ